MANLNWGTGEQRQSMLGNKGTYNVLGIKKLRSTLNVKREQENTSKFLKVTRE